MNTLSDECEDSPYVFELELATAAHDLRNRLGVAGCEVQQLRRRLPGKLDPSGAALAECLEAVERSMVHTNALLEELLARAWGQARVRGTSNPSLLDLVLVTKRVIASRSCTSARHRVSLVASVPSLAGAWDEARLTHLVCNLLTNAMQYSPAGGEVVVAVHRQADEARLQVTDHGIGIPATDLPHVFEPFFRARNAEGVAPGLGLGLATARMVVEQYGGSLEVDSVEGIGTTFTVRLPMPTT